MRELSRLQGADAALTAPSQNCTGTLRKPHAPQAASLSRVLAMRTFSVGSGWGGASDTGKGAVCHHQLLVPKLPQITGRKGFLRASSARRPSSQPRSLMSLVFTDVFTANLNVYVHFQNSRASGS